MSSHINPKIITEGIKFYIDAANPACFQSGNTTCTNLVTGGLVTGANGQPGTGAHTPNTANFPAYDSSVGGCWVWTSTKGMNIEEDLGTLSTVSISFWVNRTTSGTSEYLADFRNGSGNYIYTNGNSYNITTTSSTVAYNFSETYVASDPLFLNRWLNITIVKNVSEMLLYLNGTATAHSGTGYISNTVGINGRIGVRYDAVNGWDGYIASVAIWDKLLTPTEVAANFQAMRKRFGV